MYADVHPDACPVLSVPHFVSFHSTWFQFRLPFSRLLPPYSILFSSSFSRLLLVTIPLRVLLLFLIQSPPSVFSSKFCPLDTINTVRTPAFHQLVLFPLSPCHTHFSLFPRLSFPPPLCSLSFKRYPSFSLTFYHRAFCPSVPFRSCCLTRRRHCSVVLSQLSRRCYIVSSSCPVCWC